MNKMEEFKMELEVKELMKEFTDHTMLRIAAQNLVSAGWTPEDKEELRVRHFEDIAERAKEIGYTLTADDYSGISEGFEYFMKEIEKASNN